MNRIELEKYIYDEYGVAPEHPWLDSPGYEVFRRADNKKWFALIMDIPAHKLGIASEEFVDVVNLKCDSLLIGSLMGKPGYFPAWHMNKNHWITVLLDGGAPDNEVCMLLDMSYRATAPRANKKSKNDRG